jgi:hypothetical protein
MATDAQVMHQELEPLGAGETTDQRFVNTFDEDVSGHDFTFTLSSKVGRTPALTLTTQDGEIDVAAEADGDEFTVTITVHYLAADTEDIVPGDYAFELRDTTLACRVAAGLQPVVPLADIDETP